MLQIYIAHWFIIKIKKKQNMFNFNAPPITLSMENGAWKELMH